MFKHIASSLVIAVIAAALMIGLYHGTKNAIGIAHADTPAMLVDAGSAALDGSGSATGITAITVNPTNTVITTRSGSSTVIPAPTVITVPATIDPDATTNGLLGFLLTGQYLPAIGGILILIVWGIRAGLAVKIKWFATKIGGLVLGFGSVFLLFVGVALQARVPISGSLIGKAFAAGLVAAGGWGHIKDLIGWAQVKADPTITAPTIPGIPSVKTPSSST